MLNVEGGIHQPIDGEYLKFWPTFSNKVFFHLSPCDAEIYTKKQEMGGWLAVVQFRRTTDCIML